LTNLTKPSEDQAVSVAQEGENMARRKEPDKLSQEVSKALAAGMSYGKWKAMQEPVKIEKQIPEGWKVCSWCKKAFKPNRANQIYCEPHCRNEATAARQRAERIGYVRPQKADRRGG